MSWAACTIVARNYLSHASVVAESYLRHHPAAHFYVLVVDGWPEGMADWDMGLGVRLIRGDALPLPSFRDMSFKYDVTEFCTALKPSLLKLILNEYHEDAVTYLDPDILIMRSLDELGSALDNWDVVLTPHLLDPIPLDSMKPSEQDVLIAGAYNLGFVSMRSTSQTNQLLDWWEERLRDKCYVDTSAGLMVDQKWMDLALGMFDHVGLLRDRTYNVAYWNLPARCLRREGERFLVDGRPLAFFHFSGFDPANRTSLSKHQNRIVVSGALAKLLEIYSDLQLHHGFDITHRWEYGYEAFDNGVRIHDLVRRIYRDIEERERRQFGDPFRADHDRSFFDFLIRPDPSRGGLSPFVDSLYRHAPGARAAFPDIAGKDRERFLRWVERDGADQVGYDRALVSKPAAAMIRVGGPGAASGALTPPGAVEPEPFGLLQGSQSGGSQPRRAVSGINVIGYLTSENGVGAAARSHLRALRHLGVATSLRDMSSLAPARSQDSAVLTLDGLDGRYDVNLVCVNADEQFRVMANVGWDLFRSHYNIGVWFWELPEFPAEWADRFSQYDELWSASSFMAETLAPLSPIPVVRVPLVLTQTRTGDRIAGRRRLGLDDDTFLFLFAFDFHSYSERKNPLAVVEAFKAAFDPDDGVSLAIKCVNEAFDAEYFSALQTAAADYPVMIHTGYWSSAEMRDLMAACDAYVSLHRAEGLGLTIGHAMSLGKPIVATAWSGNMDFMNVSNSYPVRYRLIELANDVGPYKAGQRWADPSIEHAAQLMREIVDDREGSHARGQMAQEEIEEHFSEDAVARIMKHRLRLISSGTDRRRYSGHESSL